MENEKLSVENTRVVFIKPLTMYWNPKEDITSYELALCIPFLIRFTSVMPSEVDKSQKHFRHFEIIDPNSISVSNTANQESIQNELSNANGFGTPKNYCVFDDPTKRYCVFPDLVVVQNTFKDGKESKSVQNEISNVDGFGIPRNSCGFLDRRIVVVENTSKDSKEPINLANTTTSTAEVDLDNPLTKPTGL